MKDHKDHRRPAGEERQRWHEWGVSEVIGVVLLLSLVVVGGTIVGTQLLSQPTPQKIPSVNFLANYEPGNLTLYHTGGDTLPNGEYKFVVQYLDGSKTDTFEAGKEWTSGSPLDFPAVSQPAKVTLVYTGNGGSETALRSVVMGDLGSDAGAGTTATTSPVTTVPTTVTVTPTVTTTPTETLPTTETTVPTTTTTTPTTTVPTTVITTPTVAPTLITHTINVTSGDHGSVRANDLTVAPGTTGLISVLDGGQANFTFTPTIGYHLANVAYTTDTGESGTFPAVVNAYTLANVSRNYSVTASFAINTYTIRVTASPGGNVTAATTQSGTVLVPAGTTRQITVAYGEQPTFTFTPDVGSHLSDVSINGTAKGPVATYTFPPVTDNSNTVDATFTANVYSVNVTSGLNGSVQANDRTVTAGTTGTVNVGYNGEVQFTYLPTTGHHIDSVSYTAEDGSQQQLPVDNNTSVLSGIKSNSTVVANFAVDTFAITVTPPQHGTIAPNGTQTVDYNSTPTFTFTPETGYHLAGVTVDGSPVTPNGNTYTFPPVTGAHTLAATFAIDTFTINATAGDHGTINPSGAVPAAYGDSKVFAITADTGYHITNVTVDHVQQSVPAGNTSYQYTFTSITSDHAINATFAINTYTINATAGDHGTITPNGTQTVNYGDSRTFNITPATGYRVADVIVDGVSQGAITTYTLANIQGDHTIAATFTQIQYTIDANTGPLGTINPSGSLSYAYHATPSFTVGAIPGYHIASIIVDGVRLDPAATYTFAPLEGDHTITADFAKNTYTITATAGDGGTITPSGIVQASYLDNRTFTITPGSGNTIDDVVVDGISIGPASQFTFTQVNGNHTIQAYFDINRVGPYSIAGYIWNDLNNNGVWDSGEPPLASWTVQAQGKGTAQDWYVVNQTVSDSTGYYIINYLPKDHYHVVEVQQPGWDQTYPTKHEGYYVDNLNMGRDDKHQHVTDRNFGNHMTAVAGNQILLNDPNAGGVMKDGTYIQFTGTTWREWPQPAHTDDFIEMDPSATLASGLDIVSGNKFRIPWQTQVKIVINGDQPTGQIYESNNKISTFQFDNVKVYFNGNLVATGKITGIWVNGYTGWQSTLTFQMGTHTSGAQFQVDEKNVIDPPWWPYKTYGLTVYGISPQHAPYSDVLNFNYQSSPTYLVCSGSYDYVTP